MMNFKTFEGVYQDVPKPVLEKDESLLVYHDRVVKWYVTNRKEYKNYLKEWFNEKFKLLGYNKTQLLDLFEPIYNKSDFEDELSFLHLANKLYDELKSSCKT